MEAALTVLLWLVVGLIGAAIVASIAIVIAAAVIGIRETKREAQINADVRRRLN